ncbi:MAG: hypothetical protein ABL885_02360 [Methylophilaceae bacterium]
MILDQIKNGWQQLKNHVRQQESKPVHHPADNRHALQNLHADNPAKVSKSADDGAAKPQFYAQKIMPHSQQIAPLRCERVPGIFSASDVHRRHNPYLGG